jgi:uncharacterized protein YyaL (SSP411 family)
MPNRLSCEISPYLLQHADNPVDWHPWGPEALDRARAEQKPIFLSIGYASCHWCHVMAHESFENPEIARLLGKHFVSVKVDREERPDLDQIYMDAVQAITGSGGWPLSVFLTPDQKPFFGGTYWPLPARGGMPGFDVVVQSVAEAWRTRRSECLEQAERLVRFLRAERPLGGKDTELHDGPLDLAEAQLARSFDSRWGGFGNAPKFPRAMELNLLLRCWRRSGDEDLLTMVTNTLDHMATGGIYDQLGGGFHRYSVDAEWLVPHFEKMLYDNALLVGTYLDAWQVTGRPEYARVVRETLDYVLRDMTAPEGGFYSAEDADSEGDEGKFYVWTPREIERVLVPQRAKTFCTVYDVTEAGNFEGRNIPHLPRRILDWAEMLGRILPKLDAELAEDRAKLLAARSERVRPGRDDKVLVSWNGLMIDAMARAGVALAESRYREAAAAAAHFVLNQVRDDQGRLLHCWRARQARQPGFLDDHAAMCNALVTLQEIQPSVIWLGHALRLADEILDRFADRRSGGFFYTPSDHEPLVVRRKDLFDSAMPSGMGLAATALLRLSRLADRDDYRRAAEETLRVCFNMIEQAPTGAGQLLLALDMLLREQQPVG